MIQPTDEQTVGIEFEIRGMIVFVLVSGFSLLGPGGAQQTRKSLMVFSSRVIASARQRISSNLPALK